nr:ribonuclease H-like domain-containing protein [Tanacetum cinerariifolium]
MVWIEMHRGIALDKVENPNPQSTPQVLLSFEVYTLPVTYLEEVEETIGILMEVEPLDHTKLKDLGLNTCNHGIPFSSREVPSFDEPEPQPHPLPSCPSLDVSLGEERGPNPPIKSRSAYSFRMKVVDKSTINTPPSPHVASFHPKDTYCYYHPCIDDPKKHYGFKLGFMQYFTQGITNRIACRKFFKKNKCEIFTVSGDSVRNFYDGVAPPGL